MSQPCALQITYWDAYDGQAIRIIEGSAQAQVNTLCTDPAGEALLSGGGDRLVKVWGYDEGLVSALQLRMLDALCWLLWCVKRLIGYIYLAATDHLT